MSDAFDRAVKAVEIAQECLDPASVKYVEEQTQIAQAEALIDIAESLREISFAANTSGPIQSRSMGEKK